MHHRAAAGPEAAAAERCRVLELGCGDGANLIPMALALPEGRFLGIDLAAGHIRQGQALIGELGLTNIALRQLDVLELGDDAGEFDYLIAYGLYSWAPEAVREKTLDLARACLAPNGVAYINYNACPGARLRQALREMMLWVTRDAQDPGERARRAQAFLKDLASWPVAAGEYGAFLRAEARRLAEREI
ncbi:MAG: class I SAM-dependent methyltransferase, partial [Bryobacteraceae bacterium]